jgi:TetR/AcrR family transcriptional regulator, transcriptional repressor for nem operon
LVCTESMAIRPAPSKQPDVTREKILDAAFHEIYRYGFQSASLTNILDRTGLTKGALYHHFPDKQALGLAVVDEVIRGRLEQMVFQPLRDSREPLTTLIAILHAKRDKLELVELGCPLNNLMQEMSPLDEAFRTRLNAVMKTWQDTIADALKRGQRQGQVRKDIDCVATALFIVSAWEGCIGIAKNMQSERTYRACVDQMAGFVQTLAAGTQRGA